MRCTTPTNFGPLILWGSYPVLFGIVYSETGLMVGFFLPGDSLLVTAGILAGQGYLNPWALCGLLIAAAVLGDNTGYWIGRKTGPLLFTRPKSLLFNPSHVKRAQGFLRQVRRQDHCPLPIRTRRSDLRPRGGWRGPNGLPELPDLQHPGRHRLDFEHDPHGLLLGEHPRREPVPPPHHSLGHLPVHPASHHRDLARTSKEKGAEEPGSRRAGVKKIDDALRRPAAQGTRQGDSSCRLDWPSRAEGATEGPRRTQFCTSQARTERLTMRMGQDWRPYVTEISPMTS